MSSSLKYGYDVETGEVVTHINGYIKNKTVSKKKKKKKIPFNTQDEIANLKSNFNKNFISQSINYAKFKILELIENKENQKLKLDEIDGLCLSTLIIYKSLLNSDLINLELVKQFKIFIIKVSGHTHIILQKMVLDKILGYINLYFNI